MEQGPSPALGALERRTSASGKGLGWSEWSHGMRGVGSVVRLDKGMAGQVSKYPSPRQVLLSRMRAILSSWAVWKGRAPDWAGACFGWWWWWGSLLSRQPSPAPDNRAPAISCPVPLPAAPTEGVGKKVAWGGLPAAHRAKARAQPCRARFKSLFRASGSSSMDVTALCLEMLMTVQLTPLPDQSP